MFFSFLSRNVQADGISISQCCEEPESIPVNIFLQVFLSPGAADSALIRTRRVATFPFQHFFSSSFKGKTIKNRKKSIKKDPLFKKKKKKRMLSSPLVFWSVTRRDTHVHTQRERKNIEGKHSTV